MTLLRLLKIIRVGLHFGLDEFFLGHERVRGLTATELVGLSSAIKEVQARIDQVAHAPDTTVLITGQSGTGKELVARCIHERSSRRHGPFVALNCAALTESLLEAELFGYEAGAFTGANREGKDGLFAVAAGGTLFLDEIGEMQLSLQAKLLRVLQERSFRRVGGVNDIPADVRSLPKDARGVGVLGNNSVTRRVGYAPPHSKGPGAKTYVLTVYALSAPLDLQTPPAQVNRDALLAAMRPVTLASASYEVTYTRPAGALESDRPRGEKSAKVPRRTPSS